MAGCRGMVSVEHDPRRRRGVVCDTGWAQDAASDPAGGRIARVQAGNPTGLFEDAAYAPLLELLPKPTDVENLAAARASLMALAKQGVTSFLDASATDESVAAFSSLQRDGALTARAHFAPVVALAAATVKTLAQRYDQGLVVARPGITLRTAKIFLDGVITAPLEAGKMADFIVLDRNFMKIPRKTSPKSRSH